MTFPVTPLPTPGIRALRAGLAFATLEGPEPRVRAGWRRLGTPFAVIGAGLAAGVGLLIVGLGEHSAAPPPAPAPLAPVTQHALMPAWTDVIRPFQAYDLTGGAFAKLPLTYTARRDAGGTARQDMLTYGAPVPGQPFLRLLFYRRGEEPASTDTTIFVAAARLAAGADLAVTRSGLTSTLSTRFGPVEAAGVEVVRRDRSAACLAFRFADPAALAVVQVTGLACGTDERPVDPTSLTCTVDRLDLVSAGDDEALRAVFVAAERRREPRCPDHATLLGDGRPVRSTLKGAL